MKKAAVTLALSLRIITGFPSAANELLLSCKVIHIAREIGFDALYDSCSLNAVTKVGLWVLSKVALP